MRIAFSAVRLFTVPARAILHVARAFVLEWRIAFSAVRVFTVLAHAILHVARAFVVGGGKGGR